MKFQAIWLTKSRAARHSTSSYRNVHGFGQFRGCMHLAASSVKSYGNVTIMEVFWVVEFHSGLYFERWILSVPMDTRPITDVFVFLVFRYLCTKTVQSMAIPRC